MQNFNSAIKTGFPGLHYSVTSRKYSNNYYLERIERASLLDCYVASSSHNVYAKICYKYILDSHIGQNLSYLIDYGHKLRV